MLTAALFVVAKGEKNQNIHQVTNGKQNLVYTYMEYNSVIKQNELHSTRWINRQNFMTSEDRNKQPYIVWFHSYEYSDMLINRDRKQISSCQGPRRREEWEVTTYWYRVSFGSDENVLELDRGDGCTTCKCPKYHWTDHCKTINFILYEFHLKKKRLLLHLWRISLFRSFQTLMVILWEI